MLDDKYRIERLLAIGGMGAVYVGTHIKLKKRVAIKVLNPQMSTAAMVERFHREAITASQIGHEGIAQVTDLGTSNEGEPFLVMEYLQGESLASRLKASGPLSVEDACELGCAILSPLSAAHRAGIIHRDLKPDNVFLVRQSRGEMVKLLDFGISRTQGPDAQFRLTNTGLVLGTPYYMSPEQARGEGEITTAVDLYAFGVMLYEMLVGDVPIRAENYNQLMYRVTIGEYTRPRELRPDLPEELERIILYAMAQVPEDRPISAGELELALMPFCRPVFRDHASGRLSSPGLVLRTLLSGGIERLMYEDVSTPAERSGEVPLPPADTPLARATTEVNEVEVPDSAMATTIEDAAPASQPGLALAAAAASYDGLVADPTPPRAQTARTMIGIAIAVIGAAAAAWLVITLAGRDGPSVAVASAPAAVPAPAAPAAAPSELPAPQSAQPVSASASPAVPLPTTITLRLAVEPPGAAVMLDGTRVRGTELVVPRDTAAHRLRITAAGYLGYDATISYDESQRLFVQLKRAASPPPRGKDPRKEHAPSGRGDRIENNSPYGP